MSAIFGVGTTVGQFHAGEFVVARLEHVRIEEMQAVPLAHLSVQELEDPIAHAAGIGMRDRHDILGRVAVAESGPSADLDERGEA